MRFRVQRETNQRDLGKKLGHNKYLRNLERAAFLTAADNDSAPASNPETCPVCRGELGTSWQMFECGHSTCVDCMEMLVDLNCAPFACAPTARSIQCPVCRSRCPLASVTFVNLRAPSKDKASSVGSVSDSNEEIVVRGDHSSKLYELLKCILNIRRNDPGAKILVFSTVCSCFPTITPPI